MPIRDLTIIIIVVVLAAWSLRRPWIGVMNWTWLSIMNPHRYAWGATFYLPLAAVAGLATLAGLLFSKEKQWPFKAPPVWWLLIFFIWMTLSWILGRDPILDHFLWDKSAKIFLMTFVALSLLSTKQHIVVFAAVNAGSIALLAAKGGAFTILTGGSYRVWGPPGSFIEGNNEFALATIMTIPMLHFLQLQLKEPWQRHSMSVLMVLSAVAAIGSYSRGALIAIGAMSIIFWWRSSRKGLIGAVILIGVVAMLPLMPETWWNRMETIQTYEVDASAMGRLNAWAVAIGVAKDNFLGAGMSYLYPDYFVVHGIIEDKPREAHSIYFQILGNHGFVGLAIFLGIWISTYRIAGRLRHAPRDNPETRWVSDLGGMLQVSLVAYATGGAFLSLAYFDLPYNFMVLTVLANAWMRQLQSGNQPSDRRRSPSIAKPLV